MTTNIDLLKFSRANVLKLIDGLTLEQINKIPDGFTGNIAWHIGHIITTQQGLIYGLSRAPMTLEKEFMDKYKKGTKPQTPITQQELELIKSELSAQPERLAKDLEQTIFQAYTNYTTSYGNTMNSVEEAITFNNVHEGMHIGYIMAMKRVVLG